jgi:surfactin synthase thioesterase subunit
MSRLRDDGIRVSGDGSAAVQLYCFPYAGGGGAAFAPMTDSGDDLGDGDGDGDGDGSGLRFGTLRHPGRESRIAEPPATKLDELADRVADGIAASADRSFALFGHSVGALLAYEVAHRLGSLPPLFLAVAGFPPPSRHAAGRREADSRGLVEALPASVRADPEARRLFLPVLRADAKLLAGYVEPADRPSLPVPVLALGGQDDEVSPAALRAWGEHSSRGVEVRIFPGGHFFVLEEAAMVRAYLAEKARQLHEAASLRSFF